MRTSASHGQLLRVIRSVRRRWRWRIALRGAAIVLGFGLLIFLASAFGMDRLRFGPTAVLTFRIFAYGAVLALFVRYLVLPLSRRISDERVALYLEEHEPSLEAQLLSAVEFAHTDEKASAGYSPALVEKLVQSAMESCAVIDYGRRVERAPLARSSGMLAGTTLATLALLALAPPFVRHSAPFLFPWNSASPANPYWIEVAPGNTKVARGAELKVSARLHNFETAEVELAVQRGAPGEWERLGMILDEESGDFAVFLLNLEEQADYFVEAGGVRSPPYRIEVAELPYVQTLTLEYHFPAYTGLPPQRQEDGGDIAALRGTEVQLFVTPTVPVAAGAIVVEESDSLPLEPSPDGTLIGRLGVSENALYRIVFETPDGDWVVGSPDYLIDVLDDQPPLISFARPGRDIKVTNIEEIFTEVEAQDDYGVRSLDLVYSVNGGPEQTVQLHRGRARREISASHTFYLEEIELVPGDFLSYYARATDDNRFTGRQTTTTDIYFMEVRPFNREFRQAEQSGAGGGGGGFDSSLAQRQRDIIAATFKMVRDRRQYSEKEYNENLATLALAQGRLREQVEGLVSRIRARGILGMDSSFHAIAEALPKAAEEMRDAEERLGRREAKEALPPEQRALQHLQRAEAAFREVQVGWGGDPSGGGGQPNAEELAELFELELDKQRNQYERVQRDRQRQLDDQVDETLQKLQELARRQQQENERARARQSGPRNQSGGGASQRQLAQEAEELARKLERLAREESRPDLNQTARQLRQAAEEMRRASANSRTGGLSEGLSALDRLKEARRRLEENRSAGLRRDVEEAWRRADRLAEEQREMISDVERLSESGSARSEQLRRLMERKEAMAGEVADLEAELDRLSRESRREQQDASRKLSEAAEQIRDDKLHEKIRYSRGVVQQRSGEYARNFEEQIAENLETLRENIENARDAIGETKEQRLARTLEEARDLARSLESLEQRIRDRSAQRGEQRESGESESGGSQAEAEAGGRSESLDTRDGFPGFRPGDVRQFRREFGERRGDAEQLRRELEREGLDARELGEVIARLRELERQRVFGDPKGLAELQAAVIRDLKEFEYALRRQIGLGDSRELLLTGSDEVPQGYRESVEEYYRALAGERRR